MNKQSDIECGRVSYTFLHPLARKFLLHLGLCFPLILPWISAVCEALNTFELYIFFSFNCSPKIFFVLKCGPLITSILYTSFWKLLLFLIRKYYYYLVLFATFSHWLKENCFEKSTFLPSILLFKMTFVQTNSTLIAQKTPYLLTLSTKLFEIK